MDGESGESMKMYARPNQLCRKLAVKRRRVV